MSGKLNAYGITGARDAGLYTEGYEALRAQGRREGFTLHYGVSLRAPYGPRDLPLGDRVEDRGEQPADPAAAVLVAQLVEGDGEQRAQHVPHARRERLEARRRRGRARRQPAQQQRQQPEAVG